MARTGGHTCTIGLTGQSVIAQVLSISGPSISRETIDTTDADSTSDWRTFIAGYIDGGEVTIEINYDPDNATHEYASNGFLYDFAATTVHGWTLTFSDATPTTWTFSGLVTGVEPSMAHDGVLTMSVTIKVMGAVTMN